MNRIDSNYWSVLVFVLLVSAGIALALFIHRTTTDISDALAAEVLQQQSDVALLMIEYDALILAFESERLASSGSDENVESALSRTERQLEVMRFNYSFERLDGAATAHAYIKPVIEDVRQWITDGIPGAENTRESIIRNSSQRILDRYTNLREIAEETNEVATELINTQTGYLNRFGTSLVYLVGAFVLLALGIAALLTRQNKLQYQIALEQRRYAERIKDFADTGADWFWEMNPDMRLQILSGHALNTPTTRRNIEVHEERDGGLSPPFYDVIADDHWPTNLIENKNEFSDFESDWISPDGVMRTIAVSGKPLFSVNGEFEGYRGIGRDITSRKLIERDLELANSALIEAQTRSRQEAEQALRESEMFLRTSISALPQNLVILDNNGVILEVNSSWRSYASGTQQSYNSSELVINSESVMDGTTSTDFDGGIGSHYTQVFFRRPVEESRVLRTVSAKIDRVLDGYTNGLRTEVRITKRDHVCWLAFALSPFDIDGNRYGILVMEEVTDSKLLEEQDRQLRAELAHFSRLTTVGELATGLAHELNQPLTAISHNCDALLSGVDSETAFDSDDLDAISEIHSEAERAGAIIKGLRKLVRKETGAVTQTDINQLVRDTIRLSMPDASNYGIEIQLHLAENLPQPSIDAVQIQQVLVNLERNSVDAIRFNNAKLREVHISTDLTDYGMVCVTVQDSGGGLAREVKDNLFQPFLTTKKNGMGMGLSISHSIVESHGGQLWVDFSDPIMTTFCFTLPISEESRGP